MLSIVLETLLARKFVHLRCAVHLRSTIPFQCTVPLQYTVHLCGIVSPIASSDYSGHTGVVRWADTPQFRADRSADDGCPEDGLGRELPQNCRNSRRATDRPVFERRAWRQRGDALGTWRNSVCTRQLCSHFKNSRKFTWGRDFKRSKIATARGDFTVGTSGTAWTARANGRDGGWFGHSRGGSRRTNRRTFDRPIHRIPAVDGRSMGGCASQRIESKRS